MRPPQPRTTVGPQFINYMRIASRTTFPYSPGLPVRQRLSVWRGRRLRLLPTQGGAWITGKVVGLDEWNNGPFDFDVKWSVEVALDAGSPNPSNTERSHLYRIHRANVERGGTLQATENGLSDHDGGVPSDLISFEWIDPIAKGAPRVFDGDGTPCPCCRATEPPTAWPAGEAGPEIVVEKGECPVCLATTRRCVLLHCSHTICIGCWTECRAGRENLASRAPLPGAAAAAAAAAAVGADEDDVDEEEGSDGSMGLAMMSDAAKQRLVLERTESTALFAAQRREGGEALNAHMRNMIESLLDDAASGVVGRARLWKKVMTLPIFCCLDDGVRDNVRRLGNIALMRTYIKMIPLRRGCILDVLKQQRDDDVAKENARQRALQVRFETDPSSLSYKELQVRFVRVRYTAGKSARVGREGTHVKRRCSLTLAMPLAPRPVWLPPPPAHTSLAAKTSGSVRTRIGAHWRRS